MKAQLQRQYVPGREGGYNPKCAGHTPHFFRQRGKVQVPCNMYPKKETRLGTRGARRASAEQKSSIKSSIFVCFELSLAEWIPFEDSHKGIFFSEFLHIFCGRKTVLVYYN